ncbi:MAG: hypothetical protein RLZZ292_3557 [Bacteroidota bacterium]|jgi:hypothetical protein
MNKNIRFKISFFIVCLLSSFIATAQLDTTHFVLVQKIAVQGKQLSCDQLDNVYVVTNENSILKYLPNGTLKAEYTEQRLGNCRIDATNPARIIVFYPDFQRVLFLDARLTPIGGLELTTLGWNNINAVWAASDGSLWLYDLENSQILKISPQGNVILEGEKNNLYRPIQTAHEDIHGLWITFVDNSLYLFDNYANRVGLVANAKKIENELLYKKKSFRQLDETIFIKNYSTTLPKLKEAVLQHQQLFLLFEEKLYWYILSGF